MRLDEFTKFLEEHGDEIAKKILAKEKKEAEELKKKREEFRLENMSGSRVRKPVDISLECTHNVPK